MMKFTRLVALSVAGTLISGCALDPSKIWRNDLSPQAACLTADTANFIKTFTEGESHVSVQEIDGLLIGQSIPFCMSPGVHHIKIIALHTSWKSTGSFDLMFTPATHYTLRANRSGSNFLFHLVEDKPRLGIVVAEFRSETSSEKNMPLLPIYYLKK